MDVAPVPFVSQERWVDVRDRSACDALQAESRPRARTASRRQSGAPFPLPLKELASDGKWAYSPSWLDPDASSCLSARREREVVGQELQPLVRRGVRWTVSVAPSGSAPPWPLSTRMPKMFFLVRTTLSEFGEPKRRFEIDVQDTRSRAEFGDEPEERASAIGWDCCLAGRAQIVRRELWSGRGSDRLSGTARWTRRCRARAYKLRAQTEFGCGVDASAESLGVESCRLW